MKRIQNFHSRGKKCQVQANNGEAVVCMLHVAKRPSTSRILDMVQ